MLNEIINWIFSALLGAASTFIITLVTQNKALKKSMIALLRGQIVSNCEQYNDRNCLV